MQRYTPEQLAKVLRLHAMWWRHEESGVRANLAGAYLDGANLAVANLAGANLDGANLAVANLAVANLAGANLAGANLAGAYLDGANLAGAYLAGANLAGANLDGAYLDGAYLDVANLAGANLAGANLDGANLDVANLAGANLAGAYLDGANLAGANRIKILEVYTGLYKYQCWAVVTDRGIPWVRMGCLWKSLEEWDTIGIRKSNTSEFRDDGSERSERRARAFEFTRAQAVRLAEQVLPSIQNAPEPPPPPFTQGARVHLSGAGRKAWPWAPGGEATVLSCSGGWTRLDYPERYLTAPDQYLEPAFVAEKVV